MSSNTSTTHSAPHILGTTQAHDVNIDSKPGKYRREFNDLVARPGFVLSLAVIALLCYGFTMMNPVFHNDDTGVAFYYQHGGLLAQGRFGAVSLQFLFPIAVYHPFLTHFITAVLMVLASLLFCALFQGASGQRFGSAALLAFSTGFMSFPLIADIWPFQSIMPFVALSFCLVAIAAMTCDLEVCSNRATRFVWTTLLLTLVCAVYESMIAVFACAAILAILLRDFRAPQGQRTQRHLLKTTLDYFGPLSAGIAIWFVVSRAIIFALELPVNYALNVPLWQSLGFIGGIRNLFGMYLMNYVLKGMWNLSIFVYVVACIGALVFAISSVRKTGYLRAAFIVALPAATIALSVIMGTAAPYRTSQAHWLFVGIAFMFVVQRLSEVKRIVLRTAALVLVGSVLFGQVRELNQWFYLNWMRHAREIVILEQVAFRLTTEFEPGLPVWFTGNLPLNPDVASAIAIPDGLRWNVATAVIDVLGADIEELPRSRRRTESSIVRFTEFGMRVDFNNLGASGDLHFALRKIGHYFEVPSLEMLMGIDVSQMPRWPHPDSVAQFNDVIVVNF